MVEDLLVGSTQIVMRVLLTFEGGDPVFRAAAVAEWPKLAAQALSGQFIVFGTAEAPLLLAARQCAEGSHLHITQLIRGIDIVIAGVDIAIGLDHQRLTTLAGEHTNRGGIAEPTCQQAIKLAYEDLAYILLHPLVEDIGHKLAVAMGRDGEGRELGGFAGRIALLLLAPVDLPR
ncbi:Uncharacterised protein [Budvicia aquatica]|uniref:Uncharacterized protein n=1 Tax=Budvicia aquatica TaxID=82979 RepID=A0A484ZBZ9_9GAMM|nr:Uncharacterised protein [Budvicia aquatica]